MSQNPTMYRPPIVRDMSRGLPAGAGFMIAGLASMLFWGAIAGIAAIV